MKATHMTAKTLEQPKWITKLPACKTSADFITALEGLYSDNFAAKSRREVLKAEQDVALFAGKDTAEIVRQLSDVTREIDDNHAAIDGAIRRRDAAIASEAATSRQGLLDENKKLEAQYGEVQKRKLVNLQAVMDDFAEEDVIEQKIEHNNDRIESSGTTNEEKFTAKTKLGTIRTKILNDLWVKEGDVPRELSVTGKKWARFWLRLMTPKNTNPPE